MTLSHPVTRNLLPFALIFFVIYTLGYPALVASILFRPENIAKAKNDQYLRCMKTGRTRKTNKKYFNFRSKFSTLCEPDSFSQRYAPRLICPSVCSV